MLNMKSIIQLFNNLNKIRRLLIYNLTKNTIQSIIVTIINIKTGIKTKMHLKY